jgi:hypothetical protein
MIITETCIGDAAEFSIDNADEQVCKTAYRDFLHDHQTHEGHSERMAIAKGIFQSMTIPPIVKT